MKLFPNVYRQLSDIYEGFGQGTGCADAAGVHGGADLIAAGQ